MRRQRFSSNWQTGTGLHNTNTKSCADTSKQLSVDYDAPRVKRERQETG